MQILQPLGWKRPKGYSNGISTKGQMIFMGGQVGWNSQEEFESEVFSDQAKQALSNIVAILAEAGGRPEHIVRMTWYVKDLDAYRNNLAGIGQAYRDVIGKNFPAMAVIGVADLVERGAMIEIETTAVVEIRI